MGLTQYASDIAENDSLRSNHVRRLVHERDLRGGTSGENNIPRVVVQYWHNPDYVPGDVKECISSWEKLEEFGYEHFLFNDKSARNFISRKLPRQYVSAFDLCYHPAMRCDYFRLCYILSNGGFYVDADEIYKEEDCNKLFSEDHLKVQPLCYDSSRDKMVSPEEFIYQRKSSPDWIFYINNNPIIAPPHHPVIEVALNRATRILLNQERDRPKIQSTTGPGNLTASLVKYSTMCNLTKRPKHFSFIYDWSDISSKHWSLSYRNDKRNWRKL